MKTEDIEAQKKADAEIFEADIKNTAQQLPDHKSKEFTFTKLEQQMLAEQDTIVALAGLTKDKILNELALKRTGVVPNPDVYMRYSIGLGRFVVFQPKLPKIEKQPVAK